MSTANRDLDRAVERLRQAAAVVSAQPLVAFPDGPRSTVVRFRNSTRLRAFGPLHGSSLTAFVSLETSSVVREFAGDGVITRSYRIALLDRAEREVLAWHWQPGPEFAGPDYPHLQVSAAVGFPDARGHRTMVDLDKVHLPTGPVSLAGVVRMLVEEFGVQPVVADWRERLAGEPV